MLSVLIYRMGLKRNGNNGLSARCQSHYVSNSSINTDVVMLISFVIALDKLGITIPNFADALFLTTL